MVYVLSKDGKPLMPTERHGKVRRLLKDGKAKVVKRTPFTIQLLYDSTEYTQPIVLGVDSGYANVGLSAITEKKEVFSAEVKLRTDIVKLVSDRSQYRRSRRGRKTRYRKARFLNRRTAKGWLAPSIQHKLDSHIKLVEMVKKILPITKVVVEVAAFDIQKIKNPDISGAEYQQGEQLDFSNTREYVLYRDGHTCQNCKGKSGEKRLEVHHIISRQTGGDRPGNLITLCKVCHEKVTQGNIKLKIKTSKGFMSEAFMTMVRWRIIDRLRELGISVSYTYGYRTKTKRQGLGIEKSHKNDAFVIANGANQIRNKEWYYCKKVRCQNRQIHKATINKGGTRNLNQAPFVVHGFRLFDRVRYMKQECFIFGRRLEGYFQLRLLNGHKIRSGASWRKLLLLGKRQTLLIQRMQYIDC